ncbi:MAG TPA: glycosyltransferase family 39 protein [Candidatus Binataceae bacterium]|nr:glycosyltransferase family 39 protein [Candidatus Binataceae bacterium]
MDSSRPVVVVLLLAAVAAGAMLRLWHLGASELSPDEAASWAAAAAPTVAGVLARSAVLNPGKLAAYDLVLHGWIQVFGDGTLTMRLLSTLLGVVAIMLVYWVARELLTLGVDFESGDLSIDYPAALSALLFAVTLAMIRYTREARMYPLMIAAQLAQTGFLLRAHRRGGLASCAAVSLFTALSFAANFTAVFLIAAQSLWLLLSKEGRRCGLPWRPLAALAAGGIVFLPVLASAVQNSVHALNEGALNWISPPSWWGLFSFFNRAAGTLPFPVLLLLAVWGAISQWRVRSAAIVFALFWMWGPVLLLYLVSLAITPMLVERYALSSLVPFMILAALGICEFVSSGARTAAVAIAVAVSIAHAAPFLRKPPSLQWTHAAQRIEASSPRAVIAVAPGYGANVLRYYFSGKREYAALPLTLNACAGSDFLFLWDHALSGPSGKDAHECSAAFKRTVFSEKDVNLLAR